MMSRVVDLRPARRGRSIRLGSCAGAESMAERLDARTWQNARQEYSYMVASFSVDAPRRGGALMKISVGMRSGLSGQRGPAGFGAWAFPNSSFLSVRRKDGPDGSQSGTVSGRPAQETLSLGAWPTDPAGDERPQIWASAKIHPIAPACLASENINRLTPARWWIDISVSHLRCFSTVIPDRRRISSLNPSPGVCCFVSWNQLRLDSIDTALPDPAHPTSLPLQYPAFD